MITKQSLQRSEELTLIAQDFLLYKKQFLSESNKNNIYVDLKKEILSYFKSTESDWNDWKWQLKHRITNAQVLSDLFKISVERKDEINLIGKTYRWAITPYFLAQIKKKLKQKGSHLLWNPFAGITRSRFNGYNLSP